MRHDGSATVGTAAGLTVLEGDLRSDKTTAV
jgi:hypothetical protein